MHKHCSATSHAACVSRPALQEQRHFRITAREQRETHGTDDVQATLGRTLFQDTIHWRRRRQPFERMRTEILSDKKPRTSRKVATPPFPRPSPRGTPVSRALPPPAARVQTARCPLHLVPPHTSGATARRGGHSKHRGPGILRWRIALGGRQRKRPFGIPIRPLGGNAEASLHGL